MKMTYENSLLYKIEQHIKKASFRVFMPKDFVSLGSYRQISRALQKLIEQHELVKIGFGLYAKAYVSPYIEEPLLVDGFDTVAREALDRMQVQWEPGSAEQEYNAGKTQQVPTQNVVRLKSRLRRNIQYQGRQIYFERGLNAR
jgi:hypothetical protein